MSKKNSGLPADSRLILDIYGRVSRLMDKRMRSVDGQLMDCRVCVEEYGAEVGEVLADPGKSAWDERVKRPDWDTLMERLESGASHGVCVFDLSRFSRQPSEGERLIKVAQRGLVVLDSEREFDLTTPDGKASFRDQMKMAAYYSDRLSTTSKRGKRLKAMAGEPNNSHRAFGFEPDGVTLRVAEVEVMREAARRLLEGDEALDSLNQVVAGINALGVRTAGGPCPKHNGRVGKSGRDGRRCDWCGRERAKLRGDGMFTAVTFKQMLMKRRNMGDNMLNGVVMGQLPGEPVFDQETWDGLTALFAARRRGRPNSETYLCSGIAICGRCRNRLTGRPRSHLSPYPDGSVRRQYWCQKRVGVSGGCGRLSVDQRAMDAHMRALVVEILASPKHAAQIEAAAKARKEIDEQCYKLEAKIADTEHTANELAARLGRDELSLARYDAAAGPLEKRLATMRADLAELNKQRKATPRPSAGAMTKSRQAWEKRWDAATTEEKRTLMRRALNGQTLVVGPADDVHRPPVFDPKRVTIEPARTEM